MRKGPQDQRRPADVIGAAVQVMGIEAVEEAVDAPVDDGKDPAAADIVKKSGAARPRSPTVQRRQEIVNNGAARRSAKS